jgi:hypothetical protein
MDLEPYFFSADVDMLGPTPFVLPPESRSSSAGGDGGEELER